jgi:hypothetical protein
VIEGGTGMCRVALILAFLIFMEPALAYDEASWVISQVNIMSLLDEGARLISVTVQDEPESHNRNTFLYLQLKKSYIAAG